MIYVGIDNGADGAISALRKQRDMPWEVLLAEPAPTLLIKSGKRNKRVPDIRRMVQIVAQIEKDHDPAVYVLEKAQVYPGEGSVTSFNYGRGFGAWEGILAANEAPYAIVDPKVWQKAMLAGIEGEDTKVRAVLRVQRSVPSLNLVQPRCRTPHVGVADAVCMALYAETLSW